MLKSMRVIGLAGLMTLTCLPQTNAPEKQGATSQTVETAPKKFYQLSFVVQELENERVINSRSYSIIMRSDKDRGSIRAGEKIPFAAVSGASPQYQLINVGVELDCQRLEDFGTGISLEIKADISSVIETHGENSPPASLPIIRNNQWESSVVLPLRQPTVLFSSDDPASKRRMQLQLTVTPVR